MVHKSAGNPIIACMMVAISASFVLGGYEFIRTPTNTLFVATYGKEQLPLVTALIPVAVAFVTYLYLRLLTRFGPRRTLLITSAGSALLILCGFFAVKSGLEPVLWPLFLLREAYVVLLIEQYWSFLNSTLNEGEARKFNGPICGVASIGSILAGIVGARFAERLGSLNMVALAALVTLPAVWIADKAYRRFGEPRPATKPDSPTPAQSEVFALALFRKEKVLGLLLAVVILAQLISTVLGLGWQGALQAALADTDKQSAYSYAFFAWVNGIAAALQFVLAPLFMQFLGPRIVHLIIPLVHVAACGFYFKEPGLWSLSVAFAAFKCIDYSLFRAAKEVLYVPLPFAARYRAKEIIDVFGYRFSKGASSAIIAALTSAGFVFAEGVYTAIALVAATVWLGLALPLGKSYAPSIESPVGDGA